MSFTKPSPDGRVDDKKEKYVSFSTNEDSKVVSPYNGYVKDIKDDGSNKKEIFIEHQIDGNTFYSSISGIKTVKTFKGEKVYKNDIIGFSSDKIYLRFYDSSSRVLKNPYDILQSGSISKLETGNETDKDSEKKDKKDNKPLIKSPESSIKRPALYQGFLKAVTAPLWIAGDILKGNKKEDEEKLNEEIERIKTLLK